MVLLAYSPPPLKSLDYDTWGVLQAKGNDMAQLKMGSPERTIRQVRPSNLGMVAAKLLCVQATLGEDCRRRLYRLDLKLLSLHII
jgi:hypothetical protein